MKKKFLAPIILGLLLAACGPVSTTEPSKEPTSPSEPTVSITDPSTTEEPSVTAPSVVPPSVEDEPTAPSVVPPSEEDPTAPSVVPPSTTDPSVEPIYEYTTKQSSFSSTNGNVGGDSNISYNCYKGGGTSDPAIYDNIIRLYQISSGDYGGYITLTAKNGYSITEAKIGTAMSTTIAYSLNSSKALSSSSSLASGSKYTVSDLSNSSITFYCLGNSKTERLYVNYLEVTYVGGTPSNPTVPSVSNPTTAPSTTTPSTSNPTTNYEPGEDTYSGSYYNSIDRTDEPNTVLGELRDLIIDTHHTYTSYKQCGSGSNDLKKTDADPNQSGNILLFYSRKSVAYNSSVFNREHVWPKSLGSWETSVGGSDMHHIRPTYNQINSDRGSKVFGEVSGGDTSTGPNGEVGGYYTNSVFEPLDHVKGDTARIIMYMFVHYNTPSGIQSNTNKSGNVPTSETCGTSSSLALTKVIAGSKSEAFALILKWHNEDPVDQLEITRNEEVYKIQGNRNPFIDYPSLADYIWG